MKTFIYTNNELREILLDLPLKVNESGTVQIETLPVSGTGWIEGKEYVDGKDFERQWEIFSKLRKEWTETNEVAKDVLKRKGWETRQAAVLIDKQQSKEELTDLMLNQQTLPKDIADLVADNFFNLIGGDNNLTEKMEDEGDESSEPIKEREQEESRAFTKLCTFSDIPEVNKFFQGLGGIYHDPNYQTIVEDFYKWQQYQSDQPKKPLSEISDDDAIEVIKLSEGYIPDNIQFRTRKSNNTFSPDVWRQAFHISNDTECILANFSDTKNGVNVCCGNDYWRCNVAVYQYLQSKGYKLPVYYPTQIDK